MKTFIKKRDNTSEFKHIVGFTSDLKEFWCSFVHLKLEIVLIGEFTFDTLFRALFSLTLYKICFCTRFCLFTI